jgi:uncharacterized protein YggE
MTGGPTVAVRGEVVREVEPELAQFTVNVGARDKDRQTTLTRLAQRLDVLKSLLAEYTDVVERRETSGMHVYPEHRKKGERPIGYRGNVSVSVTVNDFSVLGELMLRVADQDQVELYGPSWSLRPTSPVFREARHAAIGDAITRATEYAEALGASITRLVQLSDAGMNGGPEMAAMAIGALRGGGMRDMDGGAQFDLDPQRQTIRAQIEAKFEISEPTAMKKADAS